MQDSFDKPWLKSYPYGVSDKIKFDDSQSLFNLPSSFTNNSNFFSLNTSFTGTNTNASASTPYVVVDSQNVVYFDEDSSTAGYTVVAVTTGDTPVFGDFQIG